MRKTLAMAAALVVLSGCGDQVAPSAEPGTATPRGVAAVVVDHVPLKANRTRGDFSGFADPRYVEAEVDYGVDPEGSEGGETLTVVTRLNALEDIPQRDRKWLGCFKGREVSGGCEEQNVDEGSLIFEWGNGAPEEDPGTVGYIYVHGGLVVRAFLSGPFIDGDPREQDLGFPLETLGKIATDKRLDWEMSGETLDAGRRIPDYNGPEAPPKAPDRMPTDPESLASRVVDRIRVAPTAAGPSKLTDFGKGAVGAHLEFPATKRFAAYSIDVLTVVGRPPQLDPMPCEPVDEPQDITNGGACYAFSDEDAAVVEVAHDGQPGRFWLLAWHDDETYNRVESVGIVITSPDITESPYTNDMSPVEIPALADLGGMEGELNLGPETDNPKFKPVPNWRD